ncbi:peptidoglycan-associated lipoprotein Pal [Thiocystis violacea]|uniref:peptidoglycan-associated lipoprotein Pal n=1 Tax=Thiocystis violacea TaxID=13725 RepID=UPI0019065757|nr:peptidoglycan-associated lipoprotein Pal [Thiocystis violacea]MBK1724659.1 peptidoglycan-associated lipoprotein [Thiocystis violacea]
MRGLSRFQVPILALFVLVLALTGCASTPREPLPESVPVAPPAPLPRVTREDAVTTPVEPIKPTYAGPWEDPANPLFNRTIYFDYDTAEIKQEFLPLMRTHARYLGGHTETRVTLEGHTDERGTREYNLALGDQRAEAVRRFMLAEGVRPDQMATLSYGEERPAGLGHNEQSWRQNRRVIIQY